MAPAFLSADSHVLDSAILPALALARASSTGIGVPGIEPFLNGIYQVATMVSTMRANKDDLLKLERSLSALIALDPPEGSTALRSRLSELTSDLEIIAAESKSLAEKGPLKQLLKSQSYKERIISLRDSVASHIRDFTFHGNISIERLVNDMISKDILANITCVPARYNSANTPDTCMNGTRVIVIQDIITQLTSLANPSRRVVMLSGSAGSGKSTIAKSIAAELAEKEGVLAASFFFSRDYVERKDIKHLPSTLARQLADFNPSFRLRLVECLKTDRNGILSAEPRLQFQKLIVDILAHMPPSSRPWVICLDALDECGKDRGQILLRWLSDTIAHFPAHILFFLTGRPDVPSYLKFDSLRALAHGFDLDEIDSTIVSHDIRLYVERSLDGAHWTTRDPWKAQHHDIDEITNRANGLFIFAATAIRYILAGLPHEHPQQSVDYLLRGAPLTDLHDLYHRIVDDGIAAPSSGDLRAQDYRDRTMRVLSTILQLLDPLDPQSLATLLQIDIKALGRTLHPLSAVIRVPDAPGAAIQIIHLSFREFMTSTIQDTRPDLLCGTEDQQHALVFDLFRAMQNELRFNICHLATSYLRNVDVPDFKWRLDTYLPNHLRYACRFWADHLAGTTYSAEVEQTAEGFLCNKFLFWLEVLSLLGMVRYAPQALSTLIRWTNESESILSFAGDAKRFIAFFVDAITQSTPHIYLSALAMAPATSIIATKFRPYFPQLVSVAQGQMKEWPATVAILEGHTSLINSVAFSADGTHIVSASDDHNVRLWDAQSGEAVGLPFEGHTDFVLSVAFSRHGDHIVSGAKDNTVRIWDARSSETAGKLLEGHTDPVLSVAFSPDGRRIVSSSIDKTMRMWNAETGEALGSPLEGHIDSVQSVAFSPNGKQLVSGSKDKTICLWDAENGKRLGEPLGGHTGSVRSVAFSPDGKYIVSGSEDKTVRIWGVESGDMQHGVCIGHTGWVWSVAFSPDGKKIVSGASDHTIRIWNAQSGQAVGGPFEGHTGWVRSVAFSPDGRYLISGSDDRTIRIWDTESGEALAESAIGWVRSVAISPNSKHIVSGSSDNTVRIWDAYSGEAVVEPLQGHTDWVWSVAFSPNGKHIVSGSIDKTVRVWDAQTGSMVGKAFEGHTHWVRSVAFSPDSRHIASASDDKTIRLWDIHSGKAVGEPFEGHTELVRSVIFSPDSKNIVSGSDDRTIRVWDAKSGEAIGEPFRGHTDLVHSVIFSSDGKRIVSGSRDKTVRVWDAQSGEALGEFKGHTHWVRSVAFSPERKRIVSVSKDRTIRIWDAESGTALGEPLEGHTDTVQSVAFSPDGKYIVSGSEDKTIRVWDMQRVEMSQNAAIPLSLNSSASPSNPPLLKPHLMRSPSFPLYWKIEKGWISCNPSELILWLPSQHRVGLWSPYNTMVIGRQQTLLSYEKFVHGTRWAECYVPLGSSS